MKNRFWESIKNNKFYSFLLIFYFALAVLYTFITINSFKTNAFKNSLLKNIIDSIYNNFEFSLDVSLLLVYVTTIPLIIYFIFIKKDSITYSKFFIFTVGFGLYIFISVILILSITKQNAEVYLAFIGFFWTSTSFLPFLYRQLSKLDKL